MYIYIQSKRKGKDGVISWQLFPWYISTFVQCIGQSPQSLTFLCQKTEARSQPHGHGSCWPQGNGGEWDRPAVRRFVCQVILPVWTP